MSFLPMDERHPGVRQQYALERQSGLQASMRVLLIGARSSGSGDEYDLEARRIVSRAESKALYGAGSMLDLMVRAALLSGDIARFDSERGGTPELYAMAVPPAEGAPATQVVTFAGTATNNGSITLYVNDLVVQVGVLRDANPAMVAAAAHKALMGVTADLAFTVAVDGAAVTFSAREAGAWGQQLFVYADTSRVGGVDATVARGADGAGELALGDALTQSMAVDWDCVVVPENSATIRPLVKAHVADAWDYTNERYRMVVLAGTSSLAAAATQAAELADWRVVLASSQQTPGVGAPWDRKNSARMHGFELAAAVAARLYTHERANYNYNRASLRQVARPANVPREAVNDAINGGVTVVLQGDRGEAGMILDPVATYIKDAEGAPDTTYQPVEVVKVVQVITRSVAAELAGFPQATATEDTRLMGRAAALAILTNAFNAGLIRRPSEADVTAAYEDVGATTRLLIGLSYRVITGLDIVEVSHHISRDV